ncbi:hypothetical protein SUDANB132_01644 [Streptomyces sp. enrichment culture]
MAESSRPRLPRWTHSVRRPPSGRTQAPGRMPVRPSGPGGDIDVTPGLPHPASGVRSRSRGAHPGVVSGRAAVRP